MLGALIGDIVGSRFEWHNYKGKDFKLFTPACHPTDDSIMSLALVEAILESRPDFSELEEQAARQMQVFGRRYPNAGYGGRFFRWIYAEHPQPYNSFGNGAAMRISPAGFAGRSEEEVMMLAQKVTAVTHNHPEGMKGAQAGALAIWLARSGADKTKIRARITRDYYPLDFTLDEIRPAYTFDVSCQGSVPQALEAFFESSDFEDAIRLAISIGGDSDTIGAMTGGIAQANYGIPAALREQALSYLDDFQMDVLRRFEAAYMAEK